MSKRPRGMGVGGGWVGLITTPKCQGEVGVITLHPKCLGGGGVGVGPLPTNGLGGGGMGL